MENRKLPKYSKPFPKHWGHPPDLQTADIVILPNGYGVGSSVLLSWVERNILKDKLKVDPEDIINNNCENNEKTIR